MIKLGIINIENVYYFPEPISGIKTKTFIDQIKYNYFIFDPM